MRKILRMRWVEVIVLSVIVITTVAMGGCARRGEDDRIVLTYARFSTPERDVLTRKNIRDFEALHPHIRVRYIPIPIGLYTPKLLTMIAGRTAPDVMYTLDSMFPDFASRGILLNLDPFIAQDKEINLNDFYAEALAAQKFDGKQYSLPTVFSSIVLFYNRTLFDQAGIGYPDETWTWDTLLEAARKLTRDIDSDGRIDQFGLHVPPYLNRWPIFVWGAGGDILNEEQTTCLLDQPQAIKAIQFLADLVNEHHVSPSLSLVGEMGDLFEKGRLAMVFGSRFGLEGLKNVAFDWDVAIVPQGKYRYTTLTIGGNAIYAGTNHPQEAWEFVRFLSSEKVLTDHIVSGSGLAARKSVSEAVIKLRLDGTPDNDYAFIKSIRYMKPTFTHPNNRIYEVMGTHLEKVWLELGETEKILQQMVKEVNTILAE